MNRTSRYVSLLAAVAGTALLGYLLRRAGVSTVVQAFRLLGAGFLALLFLSGIRQYLRAIAGAPQRVGSESGAGQVGGDIYAMRPDGSDVRRCSPRSL